MSDVKTITLPYKPRPLWKDIIHPAMEKFNRLVLVCHRRFGKTIGCVNELIRQAVKCKNRSPQLAYVAPYLKQAKLIAWKELCYYASFIPGIKVNQAELYIEFPSLHKNAVGARIYVIGADNPDALRGTYWDMVVIDEFAQIKPELLGCSRRALTSLSSFVIDAMVASNSAILFSYARLEFDAFFFWGVLQDSFVFCFAMAYSSDY